jgi:hypothetical protein
MAFNTVKSAPPLKKANVAKAVPVAVAPKAVAPKKVAPVKPKKKTTSIFKLLDRWMNVDSFFERGLPVEFLPHVLFTTLLVLFYIGNSHFAEKTIRRIDKTKAETEDLRADYTTLKSDYMFQSKQSEVSRNVAPYGIVESQTPPVQLFTEEPADEQR